MQMRTLPGIEEECWTGSLTYSSVLSSIVMPVIMYVKFRGQNARLLVSLYFIIIILITLDTAYWILV